MWENQIHPLELYPQFSEVTSYFCSKDLIIDLNDNVCEFSVCWKSTEEWRASK